MLFYCNPDSQLLVEQPKSRAGISRIDAPRGLAVPIWIQFVRNGAVFDPDPTYSSGTLTIGEWYRVVGNTTGNFLDVGGPTAGQVDVGDFFMATATTPGSWGSNSLKRCAADGTLFALRWVIKDTFDGDVLALLEGGGASDNLPDFKKFGSTTSTIFKGVADYNTDALNELLGGDSDEAGDEEESELKAELSWDGPDASKAHWVSHFLRNDLFKVGNGGPVGSSHAFVRSLNGLTGPVLLEDEDGNLLPTNGQRITIPSTSGTTSFEKLTGVTGYTGGGANFDAVVTDDVYAAGDWVGFKHTTDGLRIYEFTAGSAVTSSPGIIRPLDWHATNNQFYWTLIL